MTDPNQNPYATSVTSETGGVPIDDRIGARAATLARWQTFSAIALIIVGVAIILMLCSMLLLIGGVGGWGEVVVVAAIYGCIGIFLFILPGALLWMTAKRAKEIGLDPTHEKFGEMIKAQTRFWRFTTFALGLLVIFMLLAFVGGLGFN